MTKINDNYYICCPLMSEIWYLLRNGMIPKYSKENSEVEDESRTGPGMGSSGSCGPGGCPGTNVVPGGPKGPGGPHGPGVPYGPGEGLYVFLCHGVTPSTSQEFCYYSVAYDYIPNTLYGHCERVAGPFISMRDCDIWIESKGVKRGQFFNC